MPDALSFYQNKIQRLRIDRARGIPAPHKPLLLLAVIDLIEQGAIQGNRIPPSPQLVECFLKYWSLFNDGPARIYFPFYHLKTSGFWHLNAKHGQGNILAAIHQFKSMSQLASIVAFASLNEDLFRLLMSADTRELIRQTIIETYFPEQADIIRAVTDESRQINALERLLIKRAEEYKASETKAIPETPQRSAAFRSVIMKLYNYTCAACRLRIITLDGASAVDAAHIIPFVESHNDGIGNGLALCKLHHWAFDIGLVALDDTYHLLISNAFDEKGPSSFLLKTLKDKTILLPSQKPFFPSLHSVRWHRERKFQH